MAECTLPELIVSGSSIEAVNGIYTISNGTWIKGDYTLGFAPPLAPGGTGKWSITDANLFGQIIYERTSVSYDGSCPIGITLLATANGPEGDSVVISSSAPSQSTFGLPADVVALITSRFGTVANFLRLRNQGQV